MINLILRITNRIYCFTKWFIIRVLLLGPIGEFLTLEVKGWTYYVNNIFNQTMVIETLKMSFCTAEPKQLIKNPITFVVEME